MESLAEVLRYVNILLFAVLAVVSSRQWRRQRGEPARWITLTFAVLAAVLATRVLTRQLPEGDLRVWLDKLTVVLAILFPYFLYRFMAAFSRPSRGVEWLALSLTGVVLAAAVALPEVPLRDPRPAWFQVFILALLLQWTALSSLVAIRLWRAGRGEPSVIRYRMRLLGFASLVLSFAIVVAGVGPSDRPPGLDLALRLLIFASALLFFVAFAPPRFLRTVWRRREEEEVRATLPALMAATSAEDVTGSVLPQMARIVAARAVALLDDEGRIVSSYGAAPDMVADVEALISQGGRDSPEAEGNKELVRLRVPSGSLIVWTSPYAPFFASEEFELLRSLGVLTALALDRCRLFAHEREARVALEEAVQLKSNFISLASHELRTPIAVIYGISSTLHHRGDELRPEQRVELRQTLYEQSSRMRQLVDQLLDLSRVEANAVPIEPRRFAVRSRVEELVFTVAAERAGDVAIEAPPELEALADPEAFDRIVSNLITNAFRYGEAPVRIAAQQTDRHFRLTVEDRGPGVAPEFVPHLFERFTRSEASSTVAAGSGLGLSIAQAYAQAHGGDLFYESAEPRGARFELVLPSAAPRSRD